MFVLQSNWFRPMQVQYKSSPSRTLFSQVWVMIGLVGSWIWTLAYICRTWNIFLLCWRPNIFLLCWRPINHDGCQILIMYNRVPRTRAKGPRYSQQKYVASWRFICLRWIRWFRWVIAIIRPWLGVRRFYGRARSLWFFPCKYRGKVEGATWSRIILSSKQTQAVHIQGSWTCPWGACVPVLLRVPCVHGLDVSHKISNEKVTLSIDRECPRCMC